MLKVLYWICIGCGDGVLYTIVFFENISVLINIKMAITEILDMFYILILNFHYFSL